MEVCGRDGTGALLLRLWKEGHPYLCRTQLQQRIATANERRFRRALDAVKEPAAGDGAAAPRCACRV